MKVILLTDGEFTGMIRSLRALDEEVKIVGFCSSAYCAHSAMLDSVYTPPSFESDDYMPFLEYVINYEKVDYIFPVGTLSLEYFAQKKDEIKLNTGAAVITSSPEAIETANDKAKLYEKISSEPSLAHLIAEYRVAGSINELKSACRYFEEKGITCVSKPVRGENAEGFFKIVDESEYAAAVLVGEGSHKLSLSVLDCLDGDEPFNIKRLVMPFLPGREFDVDVLAIDGEILYMTERFNTDMYGGLSACSTTCIDNRLTDACRGIVKLLGLSYLSCLSFKEDESGGLKLLEINPRAMGSIHLSALAGVNLVQKLFDIIEKSQKPDETVFVPQGFTTSLYYDIIKTEPVMPQWQIFSTDCREVYRNYYSRISSDITDLTFTCRFAWDNCFDTRWCVIEDCFVQASFCPGNSFMLMPLGSFNAEKLEKIIFAVKEEFAKRSLSFRIACIDEKYVELFDSLRVPHSAPVYNDDFSDYFYSAVDLRTLEGKKYSKKRNHINKFLSLYPDYVYESLNDENAAECLEMSLKWALARGVSPDDSDECDHRMIERVFNNMHSLDARGGVIKVDGKVIAFSIGSRGGSDTAFIHFEKADIEYEGAYAMINRLVVENEFPDVKFVNREEDLGLPNLRKAKKSYYPVDKIKKFNMKIY